VDFEGANRSLNQPNHHQLLRSPVRASRAHF
jgi:hypothetical protein